MEPKNLEKTRKRTGKNFTNITIQVTNQNNPTCSYNTIAVVHNRFSSLVSSGTVYSLRYFPNARHKNK